MAGNGGAAGGQAQQATPGGFTPSTDPVNPAMQPYGNSLFNNPNAGGRSPGQPGYAAGMQKPTVNPHTGQAIDPANVNFGGRSPNNPGQQPAQMSFNFAPGQAAALGNDIRAIQQNPSLGMQFPTNPAQGMVAGQAAAPLTGTAGGMMSGAQTQQQVPNANYLPQLQNALTGWGGQQQPPLAALPQQWQQAQMPMINSMPWANPFLMAMLANYGGMR